MFISLKRIISSGWENFTKQAGLSLAACFILVLAVSLIASIFILKIITEDTISTLREKVDISVYFKKDSPEESILTIRDEVSRISEVKSVDYISREQALKIFTDKHKDNPLLMDSLTEIGDNPLLASLNIKAWQFSQYGRISDFLAGLQSEDIIEKVDYYERRPLIEKMAEFTLAVKIAGILASIIFSIIAILITFNTIRLAIFGKKEEIGIQRLVGASNWFIRGPFLMQGAICGFFAALVSLGLFGLSFWLLNPRASALFSDLNLLDIFLSNFWSLLLVQLGSGILLGVVSSSLVVRKYLKA